MNTDRERKRAPFSVSILHMVLRIHKSDYRKLPLMSTVFMPEQIPGSIVATQKNENRRRGGKQVSSSS